MSSNLNTTLLIGCGLLLAGLLRPTGAQKEPEQPVQLGSLQAHLNALQSQAQRQLNALAQQTGGRGAQVLEVLSNVSKAIQQQQQQQQASSNETRKLDPQLAGANQSPQNYREQGEVLRQEIVRRAGHLQQVVAGSMEALKSSSDLIVRRLLDQLNGRLDQAKSKADRIISEPATNEVAIRGLMSINHGLNNVNNIITNIVNRLELAAQQNNGQAGR